MVEGLRKETKKLSVVILLICLFISSIYIIPQVIAPATQIRNTSNTISSLQSNLFKTFSNSIHSSHLLIFVSPQYQMDDFIQESIQNYQQAIYHQPGWSSQVIKLTNETNQVAYIDNIIEENALQYNLSAVLLIGEDTALPIKTTYQNIQKPQLNIYSTLNTSEHTHRTICVSILYPNPTDSYQQKQTQLVNTINRFVQNRILTLTGTSTIIEQSTLSEYSKDDYKTLSTTIPADYQQDSTANQFYSLLKTHQDIICLHGHGQPHSIMLNSSTNLKISSDIISSIPTSIIAIDGCYTDGIYIDPQNSNTPFISSICTSSTLHIGFFGLLSQQTQTNQNNVINSILSKITTNKTISEAINQANISFDFVFSGDPTVVFNF